MPLILRRGNLFKAPEEFVYGHSISAKAECGAGIALQFKDRYPSHPRRLRKSGPLKVGTSVCFQAIPDTVYYLITKETAQDKPTLLNLKKALVHMADDMLHRSLSRVAIPRVGCGLDELDWDDVKLALIDIFSDSTLTCVVYSLH